MKTAKFVSAALAAILMASARTLSAANNDIAVSTNPSSDIAALSVGFASSPVLAFNAETQFQNPVAVEATRMTLQGNQRLLAPGSATPVLDDCDGVTSAQATDSLTNVPSFSATACCDESKALQSEITLRIDALTQSPNGAKTHKTLRFFGDAVISGSRNGENSEWRESDTAPLSRFSSNGSWAGADAAATREPRGLRLFSWRW